jgi:hypothetical protein
MTQATINRLNRLAESLEKEIARLKKDRLEKFPPDVWGGKDEESIVKRIKSLEFQLKRLSAYIPQEG